MKVYVTLVGVSSNRDRMVTWPKGWHIPREGETVSIPGLDESPLFVRRVVWNPESTPEPYVYLVLGTSPRQAGELTPSEPTSTY
jgi:hypothetical protein